MLILTRKAGESLYIGDDIKVTLIGIQGKQARIGISLPDTMTVYREEVYKRVMQDNIQAGTSKNEEFSGSTRYYDFIETKIGKLALDKDKFICMPKGLIGYEQDTEFSIIEYKEDSPFFIYQSTKTPELGLLIADPYLFLSDYTVKLSEAEQAVLQAETAEDITVFVTITIPHGKPEQSTLNLSGPIFINHVKRIALQVPQDVTPSKVLLSDCLARMNENPTENKA